MKLPIKEKLRSGDVALGSWISIAHPTIVEILSNSGFDWLAVDMEHTIISIDQAGELIRVIDLCGKMPIVRLTSNDQNQIKRLMDAGAQGIIVPMVNTVEQARCAVAATRYAPRGNRGVGLGRAQKYGKAFAEYFEWQNEGPLVIVQIEHIAALDSLQEIFTEPGVDGYFIGPYDFSCSMGIPGQFDHPKFVEAMQEIRQVGVRNNIPSGFHVVHPEPESLNRAINDGYQLIAYGVDMLFLDAAAKQGINALRNYKK